MASHGLFDFVLLIQKEGEPKASALISVCVVLGLWLWGRHALESGVEESRLAAPAEAAPTAETAAEATSMESTADRFLRYVCAFFGCAACLWAAILALGFFMLWHEGKILDGWIYAVTVGGPALVGISLLRRSRRVEIIVSPHVPQ